jgi:proteasome activator subunit 4
MAEVLRPHIDSMVADSKETKQRVAAEMVAGLGKGSKHWGFEESQRLREYLVPVIKKGLAAATPETAQDWAVCVAYVADGVVSPRALLFGRGQHSVRRHIP